MAYAIFDTPAIHQSPGIKELAQASSVMALPLVIATVGLLQVPNSRAFAPGDSGASWFNWGDIHQVSGSRVWTDPYWYYDDNAYRMRVQICSVSQCALSGGW